MTSEEKMTPEEAIAEISFLKVAVNKVMEQALDMAIKALSSWEEYSDKLWKEAYERGKTEALSQEPTEKPMTVDEMEREYEKSKALFHKIVECEDAISRDMALEKMADYVASGYADSAEDFEEYSRIICQLPSVQRTSNADKKHVGNTLEDAISRDAVLNLIEKGECLSNGAVKKLPSVTQKSGKWIEHPEIETSTPEYLMFYECSECGNKQCFCKSDIHKKRFCSNCGAKMESEDKE